MSRSRITPLQILLLAAAILPTPFAFGEPTLEPALAREAGELRDRARETADPWTFVADLTREIGPRPAGSENDRRAVAWAKERLETLGFPRVWTEPVPVTHWERGEESGKMVAPWTHDMVTTALGGSIGTPHGGLEAEVVGVADVDALADLPDAAIAGKIVFFHGRMERGRYGQTYGPAVVKRRDGAAEAAARGARAVLIRSVGTSNHRFAHTGSLRYRDDVRKIPAAALSNPDADVLEAALESGNEVRFRLELDARVLGQEMSANVLAEIPGRESPEEVVLMAAHLDSWDLGTGAMDDGSGCAIVSAALAELARMPRAPRRTVRILLAANEERGLDGARAYAAAHGRGATGPGSAERHVAAFESDFGIGPLVAFRSKVAEADLPFVSQIHEVLTPFEVPYQGNMAFGGADLIPLRDHGVPFFDLPGDATDYFDLHHTADDTLDKLDSVALRDAAAAYATLAWILAETEYDLAPVPTAAAAD